MPTDQLRRYCTFLDPEAPSFAPGQVIIVLQTLTDGETEPNCDAVLAVWHNKTWFNPRTTNVFVLKSANAAARSLGLETCICWRPKYTEMSGTCLEIHNPNGDGSFVYVPQTAPRAFLVTLLGVSVTDVEDAYDVDPGFGLNQDDNCWERLSYRPENYASEVRFIASYDPTNNPGAARFWSSVLLSGEDGEWGNYVYVDHFPCAYSSPSSIYVNNATALAGSAVFDFCGGVYGYPDPEDRLRVGELVIHVVSQSFYKDPDGVYHGMQLGPDHRISIPIWREGDDPVDLWKPRTWPVENQHTQFTGGSHVGLWYTMHVNAVRVEPVA